MSVEKRIRVIVGHYGSGKSEFSVNYAVKLSEAGFKTALVDLDIVNPYFRSREMMDMLGHHGVKVYSNSFGREITAEIPAITARIRKPLENEGIETVIDVGGDDIGARTLKQFDRYLNNENCDVFCVVNANRPQTSELSGIMDQIDKIENETGLRTAGIINNTHLLNRTKPEDIIKGYLLCSKIYEKRNIPVKYNCCDKKLIDDLNDEIKKYPGFITFPMDIYLRDKWQNR